MEPDELRRWIGEVPLVTLVLVCEVLSDELEGRAFSQAASRVRDAQADLIARILGRRQEVQP